jgi:hypothetical protein
MALDTLADRLAAAVEEVDADGVLVWRYTSLRRAGYRPQHAARLARRRGVDLHVATDLLERGCDEPTALRILL